MVDGSKECRHAIKKTETAHKYVRRECTLIIDHYLYTREYYAWSLCFSSGVPRGMSVAGPTTTVAERLVRARPEVGVGTRKA